MGKPRRSQFRGNAHRRRMALDLKEQRWEEMEKQLDQQLEDQPEEDSGPEVEPCSDTDFEPGLKIQAEQNIPTRDPDSGTWASLPPELRNHILDLASCEVENPAHYVNVCREWQPWFEMQTFRSIEIDSNNREENLYQFGRIIRNGTTCRWRFVRHVKFNIYLLTNIRREEILYLPETRQEAERNSQAFTTVMVQFLKIFASCPDWCRISIELCISSPKDFREKDMTHLGQLQRYLGRLIDLRIKHTLPRVPAVRELIIKRENHRQMSPRCLSRLFQQSFVNTERFSLQRCCRISETQTEVEYMRDLRDVLIPALPSTLRKFFFHSSFVQEKWIKRHSRRLLNPDSLSEECSSFHDLLQAQSGLLTDLAFSHPALIWPGDEDYIVSHPKLIWSGEDRRIDFALPPKMFWNASMFRDMETVWLKAPLRIALRSDFLDQILISAALLAASMPKLRMMGLWTDTTGLAKETVFQYIQNLEGEKPMIRWASEHGDETPFSDEVLSAWRLTAAKHNSGKTDLRLHSAHIVKVNVVESLQALEDGA